jgi:hypothetical protein
LTDSKAFIVFVRSEAKKTFGFLVPNKYEATNDWKITGTQLCWYWIEEN